MASLAILYDMDVYVQKLQLTLCIKPIVVFGLTAVHSFPQNGHGNGFSSSASMSSQAKASFNSHALVHWLKNASARSCAVLYTSEFLALVFSFLVDALCLADGTQCATHIVLQLLVSASVFVANTQLHHRL